MLNVSDSILTSLEYLPTHLMMIPIVFAVTILNDNVTVENVKREILNVSSLSPVQEIIEFNPSGLLSVACSCLCTHIIHVLMYSRYLLVWFYAIFISGQYLCWTTN